MPETTRRRTPMEAIPAIPALNAIAARCHAESAASADDVPVLLDIVGGLLALAAEWETEAADCNRRANAVPDSNNTTTVARAVLLSTLAQSLSDHASAIREAIKAALAGEGEDGG